MKNRELIYPAIKTAIIFFIFGFVWVLVSDEAVHQIAPNYRAEQRLQTYKSWFFIFGTAVMIFYIFRRQLKKIIDYKNKLLTSERSLSVVLENIGEGIISTSKLGAITSINKVAEKILGMRMKEATGQSLIEVLRFYDHNGNDITAKLLNKPHREMDIDKAAMLRVNNSSIEVQVIINSDRIYDNTGHHIGSIIAFSDITERKLADAEIRIFKHALDASSDAIGMATPTGNHYYQNKAFDEMFGNLGDLHPKESIYADEAIGKEVFASIQAGNEWSGEINMIGKNKQDLNILLRAYPVKRNGEIVALVGAHNDISQHKRAMEALKERENHLSKIMMVAIDGMWDWDLKTNNAYFDPRYFQMAGYEPNEFDHRLEEFQKRVHTEDIDNVMEHVRKYLNGDADRYNAEFRFRKKNGEWLWISARGLIVEWDDKGDAARFVGTHTDITDRKLAENKLQHRVEFERRISEISAELVSVSGNNIDVVIHNALASIGSFTNADRAYVFRFKSDGKYMDKTHEWCAKGIEPQIDKLKNVDDSKMLPWFAKTIRQSQVFYVPDVAALPSEAHLERKHFEAQNIKSLICLPLETAGELTGFLGFDCVRKQRVWTDEEQSFLRFIGQALSGAQNRTHAEVALRDERDFAKSLVNTAQTIILVLDMEGRILSFNPYMEELSGYSLAEMKGKDWITNFVPEREHSRIHSVFQGSKDGIRTRGVVNPIMTKDGNEREIEWFDKIMKDVNGDTVGLLAVGQDITERKHAQEALLHSEERFRVFMENSTDASSLYDAELNLVELNKAGLAMFPEGTKKKDVIGKNLTQIDPEFKGSERYNNYLDVIKTGEPLKMEDFIPHPIWGDMFLSVRVFKVGNGLGMIVTDVTKQKQAEKAVKESEERYKKIVETTHDLIWSCDVQGNIWYINEASKQIYGFDPEEMIGENFSKFLHESQLKAHQNKFRKMVMNHIGNLEFDTEITNRKGETFYLKDNIAVLNDKDGEVIGLMGASKNVTEKVRAEQALHNSMERLELALDGGGLGLWDYSAKSQELIVSEHWNHMLGLEADHKITSAAFTKLIHPDDSKYVNDAFLACFKDKKKGFNIEFRMKHKDGNWKWISSKGKIMEWDKDGNPARMVGTNINVTKRKLLELELQRQVKIYRSFIKYSSEGIYLFELAKPMPINLPLDEQIKHFYQHGYVETCNDAFAKMYGYSKSEELIGKKQLQLHGGDDVPENVEIMKQFIRSGYRVMQALSKEVDKEGKEIYISNNVVGIIEEDKLVRTWGSQFDITDRVIAQRELEESEKKYRLLFQTNPVPLVIVGADEFNFLDVNLAVEKLLGYTREEFSKMKLWDIRPDISMFTLEEMKTRLKTIAGVPHEARLVSRDGKTILAEVIFDIINYEGQQATLAAISDITALKEAEKRVLKSLIEGEDNERKRVSIEIHDSLGQNLTAASLNFDSLKQSVQKLQKKDNAKFNTGLEFLKSAIEESRNIAHNLMPKAIDDFGLIPSLTSLFNQIEKSTGINVKFYENLGEGRLNRQIELNLYRITQEAINNLIKHSKATEVDIQLVLHRKEIIYTFEDNGTGFDKSSNEIAGKGMGLKSIFNRVIAMSGNFDLDTKPKRGTAITIVIPI